MLYQLSYSRIEFSVILEWLDGQSTDALVRTKFMRSLGIVKVLLGNLDALHPKGIILPQVPDP